MAEKQTALITGASRGLGLALARGFANLGWNLILDARSADTLEAARAELAALTDVVTIFGDVTDPAHRSALVTVVQAMGGLDALVNNASTLGPSPRPNLLDYPLDALEHVFRTNVIAPLGLIQALHPFLKPGARVINVTSDAGVEPYAGWGGYGASKAALEQLSAVLASEHPEWRIYWVDPGDMRTQMHQEAFPGEDISDRPLPEESVPGFITLLTGDLPSGRYQAKKIGPQSNLPVQEMRLVLTVNDFEKAAAFYLDGLGLPVIGKWISERSKGMIMDAGHATLELMNELQAAEVDQIEVGRRSAGKVRLGFVVDDVEATTANLQAKGAVSIGDPVTTPWQHRNQRLQAPENVHDEIQLTLTQVVGEETEVTFQ